MLHSSENTIVRQEIVLRAVQNCGIKCGLKSVLGVISRAFLTSGPQRVVFKIGIKSDLKSVPHERGPQKVVSRSVSRVILSAVLT